MLCIVSGMLFAAEHVDACCLLCKSCPQAACDLITNDCRVACMRLLQADSPAEINGSKVYATITEAGAPCWVRENAHGRETIVSADKGAPQRSHACAIPTTHSSTAVERCPRSSLHTRVP